MEHRVRDLNLRITRALSPDQQPPSWFSPDLSFEFPDRVRAGVITQVSRESVDIWVWASREPGQGERRLGRVTFTNRGSENLPRVESSYSLGDFFGTEHLTGVGPATIEEAYQQRVTALGTAEEPRTAYCTNCGKPIETSANYCTNCGFPQAASVSRSSTMGSLSLRGHSTTSKEEFRRHFQDLLDRNPKNVRLIRSSSELDSLDFTRLTEAKASVGKFPNYDESMLAFISQALAEGKEVAIQAAGPHDILVHAATGLFRPPGHAGRFSYILARFSDLARRYVNSDGVSLLLATEAYTNPEDMQRIALKYGFTKVASFHPENEAILGEVERYLEKGLMVIVAGWDKGAGKEARADVWLQPH